jgi:hypothetical protein
MSRNFVLVVSLLTVVVLAGCSGLQQVSGYEPVPVIDRGSDLNSRLEELHATRKLTSSQLKTVLASREREFQDNPSFNNRINLALLLAAGGSAIQNQARALELLKGVDSMPASVGEQELILILKQFLESQVELGNENDIISEQLSTQEKQIYELKQQLRELTTIEQNIQQRDKAVETGDVQ